METTLYSTTAPNSTYPSTMSLAVFCLQLFLSGMTVALNLLILRAFHIEKKLRTYANQYILNMTISDLLVGVIMSIRCSIILYDKWIFGDALAILFIGVQNTALGVSVLGIIAICLDRYVATYYPIRHFQQRRKRIAHIVNGVTWVISMSFWIPIAVIWDFVQPTGPPSAKDYFSPNYSGHIYSTITVALLRLAVPFIIIATLYFKIYVRVEGSGSKKLSERFDIKPKDGRDENAIATISYQHMAKSSLIDYNDRTLENVGSSEYDNTVQGKDNHEALVLQGFNLKGSPCKSSENAIKPHALGTTKRSTLPSEILVHVTSTSSGPKDFRVRSSRQDHRSIHDNHKIMRTLTFITAAFFITWLPNSINVIYANVVSHHLLFAEVARWVTYLNSLINPIAYAMAQPLFRKTIVRILRCQR